MTRNLVILCLAVTPLFAQLDSNSVTVTSSHSSTLQPDQALLTLYVQSPLNTSLDDVVAALQGTGVTATNFTGVNSYSNVSPNLQMPTLQWSFSLAVPIAKVKDTVAALNTFQQSFAQKGNGLVFSFQVQGTQVSQQLQLMQTCSVSDLMSDARAKAQGLANAAGLVLGAVLAMSSSTSVTTPQTCAITVKFALTRF